MVAFFQVPNQSRVSRSFCARASASNPSTTDQSNLPSSGSIACQLTGTMTTLA